MNNKPKILVIGGGHAGVEAALAISRMGHRVYLATMQPDTIGRMSCNPAIGGLAKGQMVREIDMMGGLMGRAADASGLQHKLLNKSKGRSVWSPRAQVDKRTYEQIVSKPLLQQKNTDLIEGEVISINTKKNKVVSIVLRGGHKIKTKALIITCGTFLSGTIHIGNRKIPAGRMGEARSEGITENLVALGFKTMRLKTGTPPRLDKRSVDFSVMKVQKGDYPLPVMSYLGSREDHPSQNNCFITKYQ